MGNPAFILMSGFFYIESAHVVNVVSGLLPISLPSHSGCRFLHLRDTYTTRNRAGAKVIVTSIFYYQWQTMLTMAVIPRLLITER